MRVSVTCLKYDEHTSSTDFNGRYADLREAGFEHFETHYAGKSAFMLFTKPGAPEPEEESQ